MKKFIVIAFVLILGGCFRPEKTPSTSQALPPIQVVPSATSAPTSIPSPTEAWIDAGNNGSASVQFQPVKSDGSKAQFWMRVVFNQSLPSGDSVQVMFQDADCQQGVYYSRYLARFDSNGQVLSQGVPPDTNQAIVVQPDSLAETAFKLSCNA